MINEYIGPIQYGNFSWSADENKEPFYYKDDSNISLNSETPIWVRYSPSFYLDFNDPRILSLKGNSRCSVSGILIMIKPEETITVSGGSSSGNDVAFTLPNNSIIFENTERNFCGNPTPFKNATAKKTISESGTSNIVIIPKGTDINNGHGDYRLFNYSSYGTGDNIVETPDTSNFNLYNLINGVHVSTLGEKGFITSNKIFRCKFAHIITGISHCYLYNISGDANC